MNENFENLIKSLQQISLSSNEKREIKSSVFERINEKTSFAPVLQNSPEQTVSHTNFLGMFRSHAVAFATALLVVFAGAGISFGAEGALPGDTLYPVKLHVNEGLRGVIAFNPIQKARWNSKRVERRLMEAQELAQEGKLEGEAENLIEENFNSHASEVYEAVGKIENTQDVATALDVISDLESLLSAHQEILASRLAKKETDNRPRTLKEFQASRLSDSETSEGDSAQMEVLVMEDSTSSAAVGGDSDSLSVMISEVKNENNLTILEVLSNNLSSLTKNRAGIEERLSKIGDEKLVNSSLRAQRKSQVAIAGLARSIAKAADVEKNTKEGFEAELERIKILQKKGMVEVDLGNLSRAITLFNQAASSANKAERLIDAHIELEVIKGVTGEIEAKINGEALGSSTTATETEVLDKEEDSEANSNSTSTSETENESDEGNSKDGEKDEVIEEEGGDGSRNNQQDESRSTGVDLNLMQINSKV